MENRSVFHFSLLSAGVTALALSLSACHHFSESRPSVLLIAVDHLQNGDLTCGKDVTAPPKSGMDLLCQNSVRFSHTFANNPLSQPALTTLLTGQLPTQHSVHDNGSNSLSTKNRSAARLAQELGMRTAFFTGGAPILRNSGLQQGFELFDDNLQITTKKFFRSIDEDVALLTTWIHGQENTPFFATLYVPDLAFEQNPTSNELGEANNLSFESQLDFVDGHLRKLFDFLRKEKLWDNTHILLVGLNGRATVERHRAFAPITLHSEHTQVGFLWKPAHKPRDQGIAWSFDQNISHADIGYSLIALLNGNTVNETVPEKTPALPLQDSNFKAVNLLPVLSNPSALDLRERWIPGENYWGLWRGFTGVELSVRSQGLLCIKGNETAEYTTLTDSYELRPMAPQATSASMLKHWQQQEQAGNTSLTDASTQNESLSGLFTSVLFKPELWQKNDHQKAALNLLAENLPEVSSPKPNTKLLNLTAKLAARLGQWDLLLRLGQSYHINDWIALAARNRNNPADGKAVNQAKFANPCLQVIDDKSWGDSQARRLCSDRHVSVLLEYLANEPGSAQNEFWLHKLQNIVREEFLFNRMQETNWGMGLPWNIAEMQTAESQLWQLAVAHPNVQKMIPAAN